MSLLEKMEALEKLIRLNYMKNKSTCHFIKKNEDKSRRSVETITSPTAKISCVCHE